MEVAHHGETKQEERTSVPVILNHDWVRRLQDNLWLVKKRGKDQLVEPVVKGVISNLAAKLLGSQIKALVWVPVERFSVEWLNCSSPRYDRLFLPDSHSLLEPTALAPVNHIDALESFLINQEFSWLDFNWAMLALGQDHEVS